MTLFKALQNFDAQRSNNVGVERKITWVSQLDYKISAELGEPRGAEPFKGYCAETPLDTVLKAPDEYAEIYTVYMNAQLDYTNGEIARFNNSSVLFNKLYMEMSDYVNRKKAVTKNAVIKAGDLIV